MKLNLGSGTNPKIGYINIDKAYFSGVGLLCDLEVGLPFKDNTMDEIVATHILEHITNLVDLFKEMWRVCKNSAKIRIDVPHYTNPLFYADPTHVRAFSEYTLPFICSEGWKVGIPKFKLMRNSVVGDEYKVVIGEIEVVK